MGKHELTKIEALKLLPAVVDEEVNSDERRAFMDFITDHPDVQRRYESMQRLKDVVGTKYSYEKAPDSLRDFVKNVSHHERENTEAEIPIYDLPGSGPGSRDESSQPEENSGNGAIRKAMLAVAASFLILAAGWGFFNFSGSTSTEQPVYSVEKYVYEHFTKHKGSFVEPTIATASLGSAEIRMATDYDMPMTIPALHNAEFKGVVYGDFVPNYKAPMLEYYLPSEDQYIYIFAFQLDRLEKFGQLARHSDAVKKCTKPKDFHIRNVNGKHVVSWKWDDIWYAAISNHNGKTLASLVEPLQYNP